MIRKMVFSAALVGGLVLGGCVAAEDRNLISTAAAVGHGNLREWDTLTDAQKREAQFNMVAAMHVLDHNINGKDMPAEYAPVTSATAGQ
jgi:outer membrane murein-binding lipoprotein Lpp